MAAAPANPILLGRIAAAHGIRGDVLVKSYAAVPEDIAAYGPLSDSDSTRSFGLKAIRVTAKGVICHVDGVDDRTAAEALRGVDLYVDRDRLPPPPEGEYYLADLVGLSVVDASSDPIGEVVAVQNYGAGDLLEIRIPGRPASELVPLTEDFVLAVEAGTHRIVVRMPQYVADDGE